MCRWRSRPQHQTEKNSVQANVFRVTAESGHRSIQSACLKGANRRHREEAANRGGLTYHARQSACRSIYSLDVTGRRQNTARIRQRRSSGRMASGRSIRCVDIEILGSAWKIILWGAPQTHLIFIKWVFIRADSANWATIHEHHVCFVPVSDVARLFEVGAPYLISAGPRQTWHGLCEEADIESIASDRRSAGRVVFNFAAALEAAQRARRTRSSPHPRPASAMRTTLLIIL
jgi:hypothetical protein